MSHFQKIYNIEHMNNLDVNFKINKDNMKYLKSLVVCDYGEANSNHILVMKIYQKIIEMNKIISSNKI